MLVAFQISPLSTANSAGTDIGLKSNIKEHIVSINESDIKPGAATQLGVLRPCSEASRPSSLDRNRVQQVKTNICAVRAFRAWGIM